MRIGKGAQVEVILGVDARGHVDVELQHLEELTLQFVPGCLEKNWCENEINYYVNIRHECAILNVANGEKSG